MFAILFLVLTAGLVVVALGGPGAEAGALRMTFGDFADESHPGHLAARQFATMVEERTRGRSGSTA